MAQTTDRLLKASGVLMDALFIAASVLTLAGIETFPRPFNAIGVLALYFLFLFLYRYVFKHEIGNGAKPLFVQANIRLPGFLQSFINYVFALVIVFFPGYLITVCIAAVTPEFSFDAWYPMIKLLLGVACVAVLIINALVFGANTGKDKKKLGEASAAPAASKPIVASLVIPLAALAAGLAAGSLQDAWAVFSPDPGLALTLTLTTFLPFRYLVTRTGGVSRLSFISFVVTVLFAVGRAIFQIVTVAG